MPQARIGAWTLLKDDVTLRATCWKAHAATANSN
jgi:hypothetical protein